jgi:UDP-N-acetylmuramoylalanine-D-glutamate ligase
MPNATAEELADAIFETVRAGAKILNLSVDCFNRHSSRNVYIHEALSFAARHGVLVVAATWFTDLKSKAARPPSFSGSSTGQERYSKVII